MSEREAFLKGIEAAPEDLTAKLVFADWLDEHDEPDWAKRFRDGPPPDGLVKNLLVDGDGFGLVRAWITGCPKGTELTFDGCAFLDAGSLLVTGGAKLKFQHCFIKVKEGRHWSGGSSYGISFNYCLFDTDEKYLPADWDGTLDDRTIRDAYARAVEAVNKGKAPENVLGDNHAAGGPRFKSNLTWTAPQSPPSGSYNAWFPTTGVEG